jgi:hypothetical protein
MRDGNLVGQHKSRPVTVWPFTCLSLNGGEMVGDNAAESSIDKDDCLENRLKEATGKHGRPSVSNSDPELEEVVFKRSYDRIVPPRPPTSLRFSPNLRIQQCVGRPFLAARRLSSRRLEFVHFAARLQGWGRRFRLPSSTGPRPMFRRTNQPGRNWLLFDVGYGPV